MFTLLVSLALPAFACGDQAGKSGCPMTTVAAAPLPAEGKRVTLTVTGMTCGGCASHVQTALMKVDGVKGAVVDHATGKAEIAFDDKRTSADKLIAAVNAISGFSAALPSAS